MWFFYALCSAVFAKIGINSNPATAVCTGVVSVMAQGIVYMTGVQNQIANVA